MTTQPLPCPLCGRPASFERGKTSEDRNIFPDWRVSCVPCGLFTAWEKGEKWDPKGINPDYGAYFNLESEAKAKLAMTWNTRTPPPSAPEQT